MKRIVLASVLLFSTTAFADVALKQDGRIAGDKVTVGDVFSGIEADDAARYLAPSPAPGKAMTLSAYDLQRISDAFGLGYTAAPDARLTLSGNGAEIGAAEIQETLAKALEDKTAQRYEIALSDNGAALHAAGGAALSVEKLNFDEKSGAVRATLAAGAARLDIGGHAYALTQVPVLAEQHHAGDIISAADVDMADFRAADITPAMLVDKENVIGRALRRPIMAGKPLTTGDVRAPIVVKKGDLVTMSLTNAAINLTAQGKALENGAAGESVRVMNSLSKQVVDAVVTGAQAVSVRPPQG